MTGLPSQKLAFPSDNPAGIDANKGELSLRNARYDSKLFFSVSSTTLSQREAESRPPVGIPTQGGVRERERTRLGAVPRRGADLEATA